MESLADRLCSSYTARQHRGEWANVRKLQMFGGQTTKYRQGHPPMGIGPDGGPLGDRPTLAKALTGQFAETEKASIVSRAEVVGKYNADQHLSLLLPCPKYTT